MAAMFYYAIRQKGTDKYLPATKRGRGFTSDEPTNALPPRLFKKTGPARQAMNWWKKGVSFNAIHTRYTWDGPDEDYYIDTRVEPARDSVELEVVPMFLQAFSPLHAQEKGCN